MQVGPIVNERQAANVDRIVAETIDHIGSAADLERADAVGKRGGCSAARRRHTEDLRRRRHLIVHAGHASVWRRPRVLDLLKFTENNFDPLVSSNTYSSTRVRSKAASGFQ